MAKPNLAANPPRANEKLPSPTVRVVVSLLVMFHVAAVFVAPWALGPRNSELAASISYYFRPYQEMAGIANGYRFFAPEPGASHLVRYEVLLANGETVTGTFPSKTEHKPRLLYHRYFMLSEFLNTLAVSRNEPQAEAYGESYARHLQQEFQAKDVKLHLMRHFVPRMEEVRAGSKLSDQGLYQEVGTFDLEKP